MSSGRTTTSETGWARVVHRRTIWCGAEGSGRGGCLINHNNMYINAQQKPEEIKMMPRLEITFFKLLLRSATNEQAN